MLIFMLLKRVVFIGISGAVKDKGGILVKVLREIEIEAKPKDLPHEFTIDISSLVDLTSVITAKDVKLPKDVELVTNPDEIIASIATAKEEVEEVKTIDMASIEVEKKGKIPKEGEEDASAPAKKEDKKA